MRLLARDRERQGWLGRRRGWVRSKWRIRRIGKGVSLTAVGRRPAGCVGVGVGVEPGDVPWRSGGALLLSGVLGRLDGGHTSEGRVDGGILLYQAQ